MSMVETAAAGTCPLVDAAPVVRTPRGVAVISGCHEGLRLLVADRVETGLQVVDGLSAGGELVEPLRQVGAGAYCPAGLLERQPGVEACGGAVHGVRGAVPGVARERVAYRWVLVEVERCDRAAVVTFARPFPLGVRDVNAEDHRQRPRVHPAPL